MTRLCRAAIALAWQDGLRTGLIEASLLWIALGLTLLTLLMVTRRSR